jgi:hypothetical protein
MTGWRVALVLLQVVGGVSLLPYPAVLVANVMSMSAEGPKGMERLVAALPYFLLSLYPVVWIVLDAWSWRLMSHGAARWAFGLSSLPVVLSMAGVAVFFASDRPERAREDAKAKEIRARVEKGNPLVWTILCAGGSRRLANAPRVSVTMALKTIAESPDVNTAAPEYGTPLVTALRNLCYSFDGTPCDAHQKELAKPVRALLERGAQLSPSEQADQMNAWLLKLALFDGPVTTREDNPLLWRILKRTDSSEPLGLRDEERQYLNQATRLHGTPLWMAMLQSGNAFAAQLVEAGARLSQEEEREPAGRAALGRLFRDSPGLRAVYGR